MLTRLRLPILFLLIFSCSTPKKKPDSHVVNAFMQELSDDYGFEDPAYNQIYRGYLLSVENLYDVLELEGKFPSYLNSIKNISQILAHKEFVLPDLYKKETGRRDVRHKDYISFKDKMLVEFKTRLHAEREEKLKEEVGIEEFQKLKENHRIFTEKINNEAFIFLL